LKSIVLQSYEVTDGEKGPKQKVVIKSDNPSGFFGTVTLKYVSGKLTHVEKAIESVHIEKEGGA